MVFIKIAILQRRGNDWTNIKSTDVLRNELVKSKFEYQKFSRFRNMRITT